jgi:YVTN family beta-propeller protein
MAQSVIRIGGLAVLVVIGSAGCGPRTVASALPRTAHITVYVGNLDGTTVTPIGARNDEAGKPIRVGAGPTQIVMSPDRKTAYVAGWDDLPGQIRPGTLTAIRTATNTPGKVLTVCRTGDGGVIIAITPDGKTVYFACATANSVIPVRTRTDTSGKPIKISYPSAIAITPDGKTAYVANGAGSTVIPISTATNKPGKPIKVGYGPAAIAVTPNGKTAYVATYNGGVTPISTATNKPGKPIKIDGYDIAITPDGRTAYVLTMPNPDNDQGFVVPIHVATGARGKPIRVGLAPKQIAFTPDSAMAYVTNFGSGTVTSIRVATGAAGKAIKVGTGPGNLAITPDGKTAYVVNSDPFKASGSVTPIHIASGIAGKPIKVGRFPFGIAIAP